MKTLERQRARTRREYETGDILTGDWVVIDTAHNHGKRTALAMKPGNPPTFGVWTLTTIDGLPQWGIFFSDVTDAALHWRNAGR